MAQELSTLAVLAADLSSVPSTYVETYNSLELQFQGILCPFLATECTDTHAGKHYHT